MPAPEIYSPQYYRRLAELEDRHWWILGMREIAGALIRSGTAGERYAHILDAGCGTGGSLTWARRRLDSQTLVGIDISPHAIQFCRARSGALAVQGSVLNLPFRAEAFDLVLCQDVLQHLPTDGAGTHALAEMHRVLRPGGVLLVRANSRLGMWQGSSARDADFQRYTLREIVSAVGGVGFVVTRATYANTLAALSDSAKRLIRLCLRRPRQRRLYEGLGLRPAPPHASWLNQALLWILRAEARYLASPGRHLAFGHSTFCRGVRLEDPPIDTGRSRDPHV